MQGLVIRTTGSWYKILVGKEAYDCRLRGNFRLHGNKQTNPIAVGDNVVFELENDGTGVITEIKDRKNYLIRRATKLSKQTHVIAANIDCLCVVATLAFPRTSTGFIDRLLVTAEAYRIPACILFNKIDLYGDRNKESEAWELSDKLKTLYEKVGYPVYEVSALTGEGVATVRDLTANQSVLFSGHSGVGKSALLNAIDPTLKLKEGEVSEWTLKGKHTTTFAEIFPFGDGYLIDTPGIKEFGMVNFSREELSHFFPEMRSRLHNCRFADCTHRHEPSCAIKAAVEAGEISTERYTNYLNILESIEV